MMLPEAAADSHHDGHDEQRTRYHGNHNVPDLSGFGRQSHLFTYKTNSGPWRLVNSVRFFRNATCAYIDENGPYRSNVNILNVT